jgi:hypothetical protein
MNSLPNELQTGSSIGQTASQLHLTEKTPYLTSQGQTKGQNLSSLSDSQTISQFYHKYSPDRPQYIKSLLSKDFKTTILKELRESGISEEAIALNSKNYFCPLVGEAAFSAFLNGLLNKAYGDFDPDTPKHLWGISTNKEGARTFYRSPFTANPLGERTRLKVKDKPLSRETVGCLVPLYAELRSLSEKEGNGITFIPSAPSYAPVAERFNGSRLLWVEFDQIESLESQWQIIELLRKHGLDPTAVVYSGGKSLHIFYLLDESVNADSLRYLNGLFVPLGCDQAPAKNVVNQMRLPGFYRAEKGKEQTLEYLSENEYSVASFIKGIESLYLEKGFEFETLEQSQERVKVESEQLESQKINLSDYDKSDIKKAIEELIANESIPKYVSGNNTYKTRLNCAIALVRLGFSKEEAYSLSPNLFEGTTISWNILDRYPFNNPLGALISQLRQLLGDNEIKLPQWFNEKYSQDNFDLEKWKIKVAEEQKKLTTLTYIPDILINEKYFPKLEELQATKPLPDSGILGIVGAKGTGKTTLIKQIKDYLVGKGYSVISITPRIALGRGQSYEWEMNWLGDMGAGNIDLNFLVRNTKEVGLCYESLKRLAGRDFSDKHLLIFDESELGFEGVVSSQTLKDNRAYTLKVFQDVIQETLKNDGLILVSDADLTDLSINYPKSFYKDAPIFIIKNEANAQQWKIDFYTGGLTSHDVEQALFNDLEEEEGNYIYCTDTKGQAKAIEREFLKRFPNEKVININGDTTQEDHIKEMVKNINKAIFDYKPRLLIYTSSFGVGGSIDGKIRNEETKEVEFFPEVYDHFGKVYGTFFRETPSQCRQLLARYRKPVPRIIWAVESGFKDDSCKSFLPETIKRNLFKDKEQTANIIELAKQLAGGDDANDMAVLDALNSMMNRETGTWDNPHIDHYCNVKARRNYAVSQLAVQLRQELIEEGHNVIDFGDGGANSISDAIVENKIEIKWEEATAIAHAEDIPLEQAKALSKKQAIPKEEREQVTKAFLKAELPNLSLTPDFIFDWIIQDKRKKLNATKLFFFYHNPEIAQYLDTNEYKHRLRQFTEGTAFIADIKTYSTKIKVFKDLEFFNLIDLNDPNREYRATDDDVVKFMERAYFMRYRIYTAFGLNVTKKTDPMQFIFDRLGKKIGLGSVSHKYREGEKTVRAYRLNLEILNNPYRKEVLKSLEIKFAEIFTPQALEGVAALACGINILQGSAATKNEVKDGTGKDSTPLTELDPSTSGRNESDHQQLTEQQTYEWKDLLKEADELLSQLGWNETRARAYLLQTYGKKTRRLLTDEEMFGFLESLKNLVVKDSMLEDLLVRDLGYG